MAMPKIQKTRRIMQHRSRRPILRRLETLQRPNQTKTINPTYIPTIPTQTKFQHYLPALNNQYKTKTHDPSMESSLDTVSNNSMGFGTGIDWNNTEIEKNATM